MKKEGVIISGTDLTFENEGVLNPAIYQDGNIIHMFYRAVRKGNYSSIGYCKLDGPLNVVQRNITPLLIPNKESESCGIEDPRIVKIDRTFYLTYTAYNGINALGSLVTATSFTNFFRNGIIVPKMTFDEFQRLADCSNLVNKKYFRELRHFKENENVLMWDKNVIFFPRRIDGCLCFLHRIRPGIQLVKIKSLTELSPEFWQKYFLYFNESIVMDPVHEHEASYIGGGCPPIETEHGWLLIYHGVRDTNEGYIYSACAALLDIDDPTIEIARLKYPLIQPEYTYELLGIVNNVVFPTGTALFDDTLYIYYGAADKCVACASLSITELLKELLLNKK